jgi:carboxymethylenebutenolidase
VAAGTRDAGRLPKHELLTERVDVPVGDGSTMDAYVARPARLGPFSGVLVAHELFGVSAHVRDVCERLASLGYVALAPDLYHRTAPGIELPHDQLGRERGFALLRRTTRPEVLADVRAGLDHLRTAGSARVGMVGLSFGGHVAYLAATGLDLAAVVVAYGGWLPTTDIPIGRPEPTLDRTPRIGGRMLVLWGADDNAVPREMREPVADALRAAGVRHEVVEYPGASHGFLCDRRDTYEPDCAADAWRRIEALFAEEL